MTTPAETTTTPASELKPKTKLTGKVVKTTLAGVLVDLGLEVPGIIHISQLSETPIKRVEDVVQVGQSVDVWVRKVKADRVELTMIEPIGLDWRELKPEMIVKGKVVRLETYGAFVEIGAERPGLVHISEMAHGYVKTPGDAVKEGDEIEVMILDVDRKKKQIRLSRKAVLPKPEEKEETEHQSAPRSDRAVLGECPDSATKRPRLRLRQIPGRPPAKDAALEQRTGEIRPRAHAAPPEPKLCRIASYSSRGPNGRPAQAQRSPACDRSSLLQNQAAQSGAIHRPASMMQKRSRPSKAAPAPNGK